MDPDSTQSVQLRLLVTETRAPVEVPRECEFEGVEVFYRNASGRTDVPVLMSMISAGQRGGGGGLPPRALVAAAVLLGVALGRGSMHHG